ncbi:MAG: hypothetical protein KDD64_13315 [Bdellovibrionales bacterium]|nr:hypothetical protein [Bdellovibrionales bacterium]
MRRFYRTFLFSFCAISLLSISLQSAKAESDDEIIERMISRVLAEFHERRRGIEYCCSLVGGTLLGGAFCYPGSIDAYLALQECCRQEDVDCRVVVAGSSAGESAQAE